MKIGPNLQGKPDLTQGNIDNFGSCWHSKSGKDIIILSLTEKTRYC
jgi:hypothetical protein